MSAIRTTPQSLLRITDLEPRELDRILTVAAEMGAKREWWRQTHQGEILACYFTKPSTRTRVSLEGAAWRLGMLPVMLRPDELQLGRGEPIADTARVLSGYVDAIAIRTFAQADVAAVTEAASVPVINALTDDHHPCQALADLLTLRQRFGTLAGLKLAYVGDGNNVAHSLMEAGALAGMHVAVATPAGYEPSSDVLLDAEEIARSTGAHVQVLGDPSVAARGAHAIYTDVWVSMGDEAEQSRRLSDLRPYQVTAELMAEADPDAVFMHCLPAHRGQEVTADVIDGERSIVFQQAANRLPTEQATIHLLITGDWDSL
jgi:ornithine carbamoyltransferase